MKKITKSGKGESGRKEEHNLSYRNLRYLGV